MDLIMRAVVVLSFILLSPQNTGGSRKSARRRDGRFFNVFQVISFTNGPCQGNGNRNGTCYTEQECESLGGSASGSCASGFGVCCIFTISCGEASSQNCTYFESNNAMAGCCVAEICPCGPHICQLRLDFNNFMIAGPSMATDTTVIRKANSGDVTAKATNALAGIVKLSSFGQCLTDTFSVSNPDGPNPPTICGINTGEHMYVESSDCCNKLSFALGANSVGTTIPATRSWSIKVTQYSCKFDNLAPQGCTQYFFGPQMDTVQTYNYNNGAGPHLASQDQVICVRRERNFCRICWFAEVETDFALSGKSKGLKLFTPNICCSYAAPSAQTMSKGFDCVHIPGQVKDDAIVGPLPSNICGNNSGLKGVTNCSNRTPFELHFRSDKWESFPEVMTNAADGSTAIQRNNGFMLTYFMDNNECNPAPNVG